MAAEVVSGLTVKVLELLGKSAVEKIAPYFGGRRMLSDLQVTMEMIQARLYDAEKRQEAEQGELIKTWLKQLKNVMYRLEDLLEDIIIADKQNEQRSSDKISKMVCFLPSKLNSLKLNKRFSNEADSIKTELVSIKLSMESFQFNVSPVNQERGELNHIRNLKEEIDLFIGEQDVIGRDEEKEEIVNMVLESCDDDGELSVICIVGMGGLGKTTLAHLVYDDKRVQDHFERKHWACISDQVSSFKDMGGKLLHSIIKQDFPHLSEKDCRGLSVEELQSHLRAVVDGKKFLLVLDDLWDNDHERWLCLERSLRGGKPGSKILVTTRLVQVANNMGVVQPYELNGLPIERSWELFKGIAFKDGKERVNPNLISIGREIVNKCRNVPLAIRTIVGLLSSRGDEEYWVHIRDTEIGMMEETLVQDRVRKILKVSYDHLQPQQKQCFAYCSLFPEDHNFDVKRLILLWMAQGFVQSLDDGHMCFMELLRSCFFHNFTKRSYGMGRCQMHDLMRDLARSVGSECLSLNQEQGNVNNNTRHVMICNPPWLRSPSSHALPLVRSYLTHRSEFGSWIVMQDQHYGLNLNDFCYSFRRLCALELVECNNLPNSIGELKHLRHLRYLRVAMISEFLPEGITKLRYLQTLVLFGSESLRKLPKKFDKLSSLQHLRLGYSSKLTNMPPRFANLVSLQSVDRFIVGNNNGLDALERMNLDGYLTIEFKKNRENTLLEAKRANMKGKKLNTLYLIWPDDHEEYEVDEELLECLQPPPTLKELRVKNWKGIRFPDWGIDVLPNLESLSITNCRRCHHISPLIQWSHLRELVISDCEELEWWDVKDEDDEHGKSTDANPSAPASLKSLHSLHLSNISKLKSLPRDIGKLATLQNLSIGDFGNLETLPESIGNLTHLCNLLINNCPKLEKLPKSIQNLTSLQYICIIRCPLLKTRCKEPNGDEWPLIQHIPRKWIF